MGWILFILLTWLIQLVLICFEVHEMSELRETRHALLFNLLLRIGAMTVTVAAVPVVLLLLRRRHPYRIPSWVVGTLVWILPGIAVGLIDVYVFGWMGIVPMLFLTIIIPLFLLGFLTSISAPAIAAMILRLRFRRAAMIVIYIEQAVRMNLPLPEMIQAAAQSERGKLRERLQRTADSLVQGQTLQAALSRISEINQRDVAMIGAAERVGRLPQVMAYLRARAEQSLRTKRTEIGTIQCGPTLIVTSIIVLMLPVFVLPKFVKIMEDFGTDMPAITRLTLEFLNLHLRRILGHLFFAETAFAMAIIIPIAIYLLLRLIPFLRNNAWLLIDFIPILGRGFQDRAWADALFFVSQAIQAGEPMHRAIAMASELRGSGRVSRMMRHWAHELDNGSPLHVGAAHAGVPEIITQMQHSANLSPQPSEIFAFLARHYALKWSLLRNLIRQSLGPVTIVALGLIVLWVGLAMFLPLVKLIWAVIPFSSRNVL